MTDKGDCYCQPTGEGFFICPLHKENKMTKEKSITGGEVEALKLQLHAELTDVTAVDIRKVIDYLARKGHLKTTGDDEKGVDLDELKRETVRAYDIHIQNNERCFLSPVEWAIDHLASTGRISGDDDLQQLGTIFLCGEEFIVRRENHAAFTKLIEMFEPAAPGERG